MNFFSPPGRCDRFPDMLSRRFSQALAPQEFFGFHLLDVFGGDV
ncbi:hypothetical protein AP9108_33535 [Arthrospira sp. PCC 9108]|nr:hypothetical protein AP9108_33535 [Arthrospira sp. PCC 9108]